MPVLNSLKGRGSCLIVPAAELLHACTGNFNLLHRHYEHKANAALRLEGLWREGGKLNISGWYIYVQCI